MSIRRGEGKTSGKSGYAPACGNEWQAGVCDKSRFLAVDFDEAEWQEDAKAFMLSCHELGVPATLEISRSGRGAHAWVFFSSDSSSNPSPNKHLVASGEVEKAPCESRTCSASQAKAIPPRSSYFDTSFSS